LLGEKVVNISMGSPDAAAIVEGTTLKTGQALSFETLSSGLNQAVGSLNRIAGKIEGIVGSEQTSRLQDDVGRVAASLANIIEQVERGDGVVHRVIYDPSYAEELSATLHDVRGAAENARRATGRLDTIVAQVERGDGTLHALIYGAEGKTALVSVARAADEIAALVGAVKAEDGALHALVYEPESKQFLTQLNQMTSTLNRIVADVDKGRGSLGGLLRDPTVYEDLKQLLGNVKRNVLFKALIRFTAENEQLRRADQAPAVVLEPAPARSPAAGTTPASMPSRTAK